MGAGQYRLTIVSFPGPDSRLRFWDMVWKTPRKRIGKCQSTEIPGSTGAGHRNDAHNNDDCWQ